MPLSRRSILLLVLAVCCVSAIFAGGGLSAQPPRSGFPTYDIPRVPRIVEFQEVDVKYALNYLCDNSDPRYELVWDTRAVVGTVKNLRMEFPYLEHGLRAVLPYASGDLLGKVGLTYSIQPDRRRVIISPGPPKLGYVFNYKQFLSDDPSLQFPEIVVPVGHTQDITAIAVSPNGRLIATGGQEGNIVLWENGRQTRTLSGRLSRTAFDKTGSLLYFCRDKEVVVWDTAAGKVKERRKFPQEVLSVSVSPATSSILISLMDGNIRYCPENLHQTERAFRPPGWACEVAHSPDGKYAVFFPRRGNDRMNPRPDRVFICNLTTQKKDFEEIPLRENVFSSDAAFSPDGKWLAVGTNGGRVVLIDLRILRAQRAALVRQGQASTLSDDLVQRDIAQPGTWSPTAVAFSPDGSQLLAGSERGMLHVWNMESGALALSQKAYDMQFSNQGASALAFSPDGTRIYSGARVMVRTGEERLKVWLRKPDSLAYARPLRAVTEAVQNLNVTPSGKRLVAAGSKWLRLWDTSMETRPRRLHASAPAVLSPDGKWLVAKSTDAPILSELPPPDAYPGEQKPEDYPVHLTPEEMDTKDELKRQQARKVAATPVQAVAVYNAETGERVTQLGPYAGIKGECRALAFYPDVPGKPRVPVLAGAGWNDNAIQVWNTDTGELLFPLAGGHSNSIDTLRFSGNGQYLISKSENGDEREVTVWRTQYGPPLHTPGRGETLQKKKNYTPPPPPEPITIPEEDSPSDIDVAQLPPPETVRPPDLRTAWDHYPEKGPACLAVSPNTEGTQWLAVGTGWPDYKVMLYDLETGLPWAEPIPGDRPRFSQDGGLLYVTVGSSVEVYRVKERYKTVPLPNTDEILAEYRDPNQIVLASRAANRRDIVVWFWQDSLNVWRRKFLPGHTSTVETIMFTRHLTERKLEDGTTRPVNLLRLWSGAQDGTVRYWDINERREIITLVGIGPSDYIAASPDSFYMASKGALQRISFRIGDTTYPFEQFDVQFNRPHFVLERLGKASEAVIAEKRKLYRTRLEKLKVQDTAIPNLLNDLPRIAFVGPEPPPLTGEREVRLRVRAEDARYPLKRLLVSVNGVPTPLENATLSGSSQEADLTIPLMAGRNKIQISAMSEVGLESLRLVREVVCNAAPVPPTLYVIGIGVGTYRSPNINQLSFAKKDATDLGTYLMRLKRNGVPPAPAARPAAKPAPGTKPTPRPNNRRPARPGPLRPGPQQPIIPIALAENPDYGPHYKEVRFLPLVDVDGTRGNILSKIPAFLKNARPEDHVVLFLAGHGTRHPDTLEYYYVTHDCIPGERLAETAISLSELDDLLTGCQSRQKLILLDTCYSGGAVQANVVAAVAGEAAPKKDVPVPSPPATLKPQTDGKTRRMAKRGQDFAAVVESVESRPERQAAVTGQAADLAQALQDSFADLDRSSGAEIIAASSGSKVAYEQEKLKNGVFTSCVLEAFRGTGADRKLRNADEDKDGRITVLELHRYVANRVARETDNQQKPTLPRENLEFDFPLLTGFAR